MATNKNKMYTIGEMSRLCNIPVTTLRYYDQQGLLKPEVRDNESDYRYYSERQLLEIVAIKELKPLGFSLSEIRSFLSTKDLALLKTKLEKKLKETESTIVKLQKQCETILKAFNRVINGLDFLEKNSMQGNYSINVAIEPKVIAIYTRYHSDCNVEELFLERHVELQKIRDECGFFSNGPFMAIFHDDFITQFICKSGDLEVLLPIIGEHQDSNKLKEFGGFLGCSTFHVGRYPDLIFAYLALLKWINNNNYEISGPAIEQYIIGPADTSIETNYVTRVVFPIKEKGASKKAI